MLDKYPLYVQPEGVETRWASPENRRAAKGGGAQLNGDRKGSPFLSIRAGEQAVLASEEGTSGMIRRIWATMDDRSPKMLRSLTLEFNWDGASKPAVRVPFSDFFGVGLGRTTEFQSALFSNPEGRSFNCCIPMPFRSAMKVTITNESDTDLGMFFYDIDYTVGDHHPDDVLYFHAYYRRDNPTTFKQDYEILPKVSGNGRFLGTNIGVMANTGQYLSSWWGEGECKIYLDGDDAFPSLSGTGTEDYIGTAWGQGAFAHLYQGCPIADAETLDYCFYRYHIQDPVYFHRDIRVTMQQIGYCDPQAAVAFRQAGISVHKAGADWREIDVSVADGTIDYGNFERQDDWSSCAYFYLNRPFNGLPELDSADKRIAGLRGSNP